MVPSASFGWVLRETRPAGGENSSIDNSLRTIVFGARKSAAFFTKQGSADNRANNRTNFSAN